jgi:hypothetical protein
MYGLPGQTHAQALADIETALSLSPTHLSCYQLTLEPNTRFAAFPPELPEARLRRHAGGHRGPPGRRRFQQLRDLGLRAGQPAVQAQPELLVLSATISASAPAPIPS